MSDSPAAPPLSLNAGGLRLAAIAAILLLLLLPHILISAVISEREDRREEARREIGQTWAGPQMVSSPVLVVLWRAPAQRDPNGDVVWQRGTTTVLPAELQTQARLEPETRRRGLFEATVYRANLGFRGSFTLPDIVVPDIQDAELLWREAFIVAGSTELRPGGMAPILGWEGRRIEPDDRQIDPRLCAAPESLSWSLGLEAAPPLGQPLRFDLAMELRGASRLLLRPLARRVSLTAEGAWATPSFVGAELPSRSTVTEEGFSASWETGTRQPLIRRSIGTCQGNHRVTEPGIGVELLEAVPTYRMVNRTAKYNLLILGLVFVTCLVFEMLAKVRLHPVQYALLGASVVLFPLLLLALGEPLGFMPAYAISAAAVVVQASAYVWSATQRRALGGALAAVMAVLFGFLHVVLSMEAYALLVGTLAVFVALSLLMVVTRRA